MPSQFPETTAMVGWIRGVAAGMALAALVAGCQTPPNVKQALAAKDEAYDKNAQLMVAYASVAEATTELARQTFVEATTNAKLLMAMQWITSTPQGTLEPTGDPEADALLESMTVEEKRQFFVQANASVLGTELLAEVNKLRFDQLPAANGPSGQVFAPGASTAGVPDMTRLLQTIPRIVRIAAEQAESEWAHDDAAKASFDEYVADVGSLRQLNKAVKAYLDIDIGPTDEDVRDIAEAIRELSR